MSSGLYCKVEQESGARVLFAACKSNDGSMIAKSRPASRFSNEQEW